MNFSRRMFLKTASAATAVTALGYLGCRNREGSSQVAGGPKSSKTHVPIAMQAAWVNDAEFTGYIVAKQKGWYADEGLELNYLSGGPDVIPESTLLSGRALIALTTPDTTVNLILKEKAPFKIIGAQYQKSPLGIVSLRSSNIRTPKDLVGKTLAVPPVNVLSVEALLRLNDIPRDRVNIVPYQYDPTPLINREVDATVDFVTNVPFTIQQKGHEPASFLMYDYGFSIFNDTVVVLDETLRDKRKELISWLRASRRGWQENFKDPAAYPPQLADTFFKGNGRTIANEVYFNTQQKPLMESPDGIFAMSEENIDKNIHSLAAIGLTVPRSVFATDLLREV